MDGKEESKQLHNQNELISSFAKRGFLLDKESLDFFIKMGNINVSLEVLEKVFSLGKARVISKKLMAEYLDKIKPIFSALGAEKMLIINEFFTDITNLKEDSKKICEEKIEPIQLKKTPDFKILSSNIIPHKKIEVKDFVTHFKNRYNFLKDILKDRKELTNLISINKIGSSRSFSIIGLVSQKRITKNKNLILEIEDLTGRINVLISQEKEDLMKKAKEIVLDDVIGVKCSGNGEIVYANDILFPDCGLEEKKKAENEAYVLFISDIHIGSKLFLEDKFQKFLNWLNGIDVDEATKEKIKKIKYLFVLGDNVDGVGVYPNQEQLLSIKNIKEQYRKLAEYFKQVPEYIKIIICPGQHDAVRVPEPQPAIDEDFAEELVKLNNVFLVSNPATVEIECNEKKAGFKVLMYHGASMHGWIDEIEDLRIGQAHLNPTKIVKYMLKHRHLSPTHTSNVYIPSEKEDSLAIKETPDIIVTGDLHRTDVDLYNNILIICCSCWQSMTPFEEKVGNQPDPCKVPMLNLKTREIKILDFS